MIRFLLFVLEMQVVLTTRINFGDEGFHIRMAQWIAEKREYPVWVPFEGTKLERSGFARPPAWNMLEASFMFIFGFHEVVVKFLTPFILLYGNFPFSPLSVCVFIGIISFFLLTISPEIRRFLA